jgi:hypothetical protein
MKTKIMSSIDKFISQQRVYQVCLELFRRIGAPDLVIVRLERDMARNACKFLLTHSFPIRPSAHRREQRKARRARPQAGSERAKQAASKKGK